MPEPTRGVSGERHYRAKLTDDDVRRMRDDYELAKLTMRAIAAKWSTSFHTVRHILRYERRAFTHGVADD
jgi:DNA invertase Pin-like site-specific DNA recombinase